MYIIIILITIIIAHDYHNSNSDSVTINTTEVLTIIGNSSKSIVLYPLLL